MKYILFSTSRNQRKDDDPQTPRMNRKYSRRAFDGLIKMWRKQLHSINYSDR